LNQVEFVLKIWFDCSQIISKINIFKLISMKNLLMVVEVPSSAETLDGLAPRGSHFESFLRYI